MKVILVNVEMGTEVAIKWERASYTKLSAYCLQILREIRCSGKKLLINPTTCEKELTAVFTQMNHTVCRGDLPFTPRTVVYLPENSCNFIVGVACCAWREMLNA